MISTMLRNATHCVNGLTAMQEASGVSPLSCTGRRRRLALHRKRPSIIYRYAITTICHIHIIINVMLVVMYSIPIHVKMV